MAYLIGQASRANTTDEWHLMSFAVTLGDNLLGELSAGDFRVTDNVAILKGYTKEVTAYSHLEERLLLVKPGTDFDTHYKAYDTDQQCFIRVEGWNVVTEEGWTDA